MKNLAMLLVGLIGITVLYLSDSKTGYVWVNNSVSDHLIVAGDSQGTVRWLDSNGMEIITTGTFLDILDTDLTGIRNSVAVISPVPKAEAAPAPAPEFKTKY